MDDGDLSEYFITALENSREDMEYRKHINMIIELGRKMMAILGPDNHLLLEYERSICITNEINMEHAYNLGIKRHAQQNAQQNLNIVN